ncbi:hypothetical protein HMPREF9148_01149 [Prevotella sp. F0091]|nr:hypothetical protein HMPREF9148_01149 [Prevotella sp. F0091]
MQCLREYLPLKQGLRLEVFNVCVFADAPRVSSIKTRIKT